MMPVNPILWLVHTVIDIYFWIILAMVVMSWLIAFGIIKSMMLAVNGYPLFGNHSCCQKQPGSHEMF